MTRTLESATLRNVSNEATVKPVRTSRLANPLHFFSDDYPHLAPFLSDRRKPPTIGASGGCASVLPSCKVWNSIGSISKSGAFRWGAGSSGIGQYVWPSKPRSPSPRRHASGCATGQALPRGRVPSAGATPACVSILYDECESCPVPAGCRCGNSGQGRRWGRRRSAVLTGATVPRARHSTCSATPWSGSGPRTPAVRGGFTPRRLMMATGDNVEFALQPRQQHLRRRLDLVGHKKGAARAHVEDHAQALRAWQQPDQDHTTGPSTRRCEQPMENDSDRGFRAGLV